MALAVRVPLLISLALTLPAFANDLVVGETSTFTSPQGVTEICVRIARMPGAVYSKKDEKAEADYCSIDLYAPTVALCPKTWSTSPGMMIYDISGGPYQNDPAGFQRAACPEGKSAGDQAVDELAKFKPTVNAKGTSGTFSASPLLYYHISRYFEADIGVPPAVWRTMDRKMHLDEVARPGLSLSSGSHSSDMNAAGWKTLVAADEDPTSYKPTSDLFTADGSAIYGALLKSPGSRYNSEINGTRKSGWGKGQNLDFQATAPFLALRSDQPLAKAIEAGLAEAMKDKQLRKDMGEDATPQQMVYWMTDLSNIVLMDYIFSQQDRVGNIDFVPYWLWVEDGKIKDRKAASHGKETDPLPEGAIRLKRTHLNDNDAGGRVEYANFAKSTEMLQKLRHFPATTYAKLIALNDDFSTGGPLLAYVRDSFGLDARQVDQIVANTAAASAILADACRAGTLTFDLDPVAFVVSGDVTPATVPCGDP